jgi:micrococcal nuclease
MNMRGKRIAMALAVIVLGALPGTAGAANFMAHVDSVVDGDTFTFTATLLNITLSDTCRMKNYDAPELRGRERPDGLKARELLRQLIGDREVTIRADRSRGKFGFWLCEVWVDGKSVDELMHDVVRGAPGPHPDDG